MGGYRRISSITYIYNTHQDDDNPNQNIFGHCYRLDRTYLLFVFKSFRLNIIFKGNFSEMNTQRIGYFLFT